MLVQPAETSADIDQESQPETPLDRFSRRVDPWMTVLAIAWLPVLIIPLEAQRIGTHPGDQRLRQSMSLAVSKKVTARAN